MQISFLLVQGFSFYLQSWFGDYRSLRFLCVASVTHFFIFRVIKMDLSELAVNERIKFLRKLNKLNQEQMGKFFGIKTSTYSQKERKGYFTAEDIKIVCEVFDVEPNVIIFGRPHPKQEAIDAEKEKLEAEIEEKYRKKYEKYETITRRDLRMLKLINFLSREKQDMVFEYAYLLFKNKNDNSTM